MADNEKLTLETTKGNVVIELRPDLAPKHVERIKTLVGEGFYDGIVFHRVIDGFMAQTGCPHGTGTGGSELSEPAGRVQRRAACARHRLDGARAEPEQRQQPVLHLLRRRPLPRQAIHRVGQGDRRHGERRQDQARRAGAEPRQDREGDDCGASAGVGRAAGRDLFRDRSDTARSAPSPARRDPSAFRRPIARRPARSRG